MLMVNHEVSVEEGKGKDGKTKNEEQIFVEKFGTGTCNVRVCAYEHKVMSKGSEPNQIHLL